LRQCGVCLDGGAMAPIAATGAMEIKIDTPSRTGVISFTSKNIVIFIAIC
jgi:hypothetical protein